mmetsp:Transcript_16032/g.23797  ORF Transcript_16032/g.23797 Transcript_16032/m.23797 type:complete len:289 (-) Transcript_16032:79-945(-)
MEGANDEKLSIANHLLMNSPPGQFNDVLDDVLKLVSKDVFSDGALESIAKAFNEQTARVIEYGGRAIVVSKEGNVDGSRYIDSATQKVIVVDQLNATVIEEEDEEFQPQFKGIEDIRKSVEGGLKSYCKSHMKASLSASAAISVSDDKLVLYVSAEHLNLRNWWSGNWIGRYEVEGIGKGEDSFLISGKISVCGHYFEHGNMQLRTEKKIDQERLKVKTGQETAAAIVEWIKESETVLQTALEDVYAGMSGTLKSVRRGLTITADKFSWEIGQVKVRNTFMAKAIEKP